MTEPAEEILFRLRRAGMSYAAIAIATRELLGWTLDERKVRLRLRSLGTPKDESKVRT